MTTFVAKCMTFNELAFTAFILTVLFTIHFFMLSLKQAEHLICRVISISQFYQTAVYFFSILLKYHPILLQ